MKRDRGAPSLNADIVGDVARSLTDRTGIAMTGTMRPRLERCLRELAPPGVSVERQAGRTLTDPALMRRLVERLTVHESSFFRDATQFDAFAQQVLPTLAPPVRVWSSGCARGQEPYSLAMVLAEAGHPTGSVIATDLSGEALAFAAAGRYPESALTGLSLRRRSAWLVPEDGAWSIHPAIRRRVSFSPHNLATAPPPFPPGHCEVVFCRNVLIYFGRPLLVRVLTTIRDWLPPGGLLFLGASESLWRVTDMFDLEPIGGAFLYRKPDPARSTAAAPSPPADPAPPLPDVAGLLAEGEAALAAGDTDQAVALFRRATYVDSSHPLAHLDLGLALDAQGHPGAAQRAFRVARTALRRTDRQAPPAALAGYRLETVAELIDAKLAGDWT